MSQLRTLLHSRLLRMGRLAALLLVLSLLLLPLASQAQMMGMEEEEPTKEELAQKAADKAATDAALAADESNLGLFARHWQKYMGEDSPYRAVILVAITLIIVIRLKAYMTKYVRGHVETKAFDPENAKSFMNAWNGIWKFIIAILVIIAMSGSLKLLGLTAGFLGMILGWSLQQPVTGIAAWLMIILKKPFRIGDRVIIAGVTGDVTSISLTHVVLNQVGGTVGGEERSGRGILIPNAILFQNMIINYTLDQKYVLDEVPVRLTFDVDFDLAKELMIAAAKEVTSDIIAETGAQPFVRVEFLDWGLLARLRFQTEPSNRQEITSMIIERLLKDFRANYPRVKFAIPSTRIRYRPDEYDGDDDDETAPPPYLGGPEKA